MLDPPRRFHKDAIDLLNNPVMVILNTPREMKHIEMLCAKFGKRKADQHSVGRQDSLREVA